MKAHEIFREMRPETAASVFQQLRDEQREIYTATLASLAANRKLRPVFIQRKPAGAQVDWLVKNAGLRGSDEVVERVLQMWLMNAHKDLLVAFLDGVGVAHDGEGSVDELPGDIDAKKLKKTVDKLLETHDAELVRTYLRVFQLQRSGGWESISELLDSHPGLRSGEEAAPAPAVADGDAEEPAEPEGSVEPEGPEPNSPKATGK